MSQPEENLKPFYLVWRRRSGQVVNTHQTYGEAYIEAFRLIEKEADVFYVLKAVVRLQLKEQPPPIVTDHLVPDSELRN